MRAPRGALQSKKHRVHRAGGINNNYSLEMRIQQQQQQQQSFYPNAQCSHQCQGFHATPANTPTLWGGSASSTKYPNDSSRPPTPSFPPYDVGTLHFVACGRPWLLHWRMGTTTTTLYIIHVVYETYDTHERDTTVGHIFGARAGGFSDFLYEKVVRFHMFY